MLVLLKQRRLQKGLAYNCMLLKVEEIILNCLNTSMRHEEIVDGGIEMFKVKV